MGFLQVSLPTSSELPTKSGTQLGMGLPWIQEINQTKLNSPNNKIHVLAADSEGICLHITVPQKIEPRKGGGPEGKVSLQSCFLHPSPSRGRPLLTRAP